MRDGICKEYKLAGYCLWWLCTSCHCFIIYILKCLRDKEWHLCQVYWGSKRSAFTVYRLCLCWRQLFTSSLSSTASWSCRQMKKQGRDRSPWVTWRSRLSRRRTGAWPPTRPKTPRTSLSKWPRMKKWTCLSKTKQVSGRQRPVNHWSRRHETQTLWKPVQFVCVFVGAGWWLVENEDKRMAWFPAPYLERLDDDDEDDEDDTDGRGTCTVAAKHRFWVHNFMNNQSNNVTSLII